MDHYPFLHRALFHDEQGWGFGSDKGFVELNFFPMTTPGSFSSIAQPLRSWKAEHPGSAFGEITLGAFEC